MLQPQKGITYITVTIWGQLATYLYSGILDIWWNNYAVKLVMLVKVI